MWMSTNYLVVRNYTVNVSRLLGKTIRTVVISDLHDHQFGSNNTKLVEKIAGLEPDIIFMDGDMLNSDSDNSSVEYYGAAEPPVRCGVSHLSGLTEPPVYSYSA